jgi:nitroreductase
MTGPLVAEDALRDALSVPEGWEVLALVPLGFADETPPPTGRRPSEKVTRWIA